MADTITITPSPPGPYTPGDTVSISQTFDVSPGVPLYVLIYKSDPAQKIAGPITGVGSTYDAGSLALPFPLEGRSGDYIVFFSTNPNDVDGSDAVGNQETVINFTALTAGTISVASSNTTSITFTIGSPTFPLGTVTTTLQRKLLGADDSTYADVSNPDTTVTPCELYTYRAKYEDDEETVYATAINATTSDGPPLTGLFTYHTGLSISAGDNTTIQNWAISAGSVSATLTQATAGKRLTYRTTGANDRPYLRAAADDHWMRSDFGDEDTSSVGFSQVMLVDIESVTSDAGRLCDDDPSGPIITATRATNDSDTIWTTGTMLFGVATHEKSSNNDYFPIKTGLQSVIFTKTDTRVEIDFNGHKAYATGTGFLTSNVFTRLTIPGEFSAGLVMKVYRNATMPALDAAGKKAWHLSNQAYADFRFPSLFLTDGDSIAAGADTSNPGENDEFDVLRPYPVDGTSYPSIAVTKLIQRGFINEDEWIIANHAAIGNSWLLGPGVSAVAQAFIFDQLCDPDLRDHQFVVLMPPIHNAVAHGDPDPVTADDNYTFTESFCGSISAAGGQSIIVTTLRWGSPPSSLNTVIDSFCGRITTPPLLSNYVVNAHDHPAAIDGVANYSVDHHPNDYLSAIIGTLVADELSPVSSQNRLSLGLGIGL